MQNRDKVLSLLSQLNISFELVEHAAVHTMAESNEENIGKHGDLCKNLFLRNDKGDRHYLVVMFGDKRANIKEIERQLSEKKLAFASEERLMNILNLSKGAVSPFGIVNDLAHSIVVAFDVALRGKERLGFHPNENTSTVWLSFFDLEKFISYCGNEICYLKV